MTITSDGTRGFCTAAGFAAGAAAHGFALGFAALGFAVGFAALGFAVSSTTGLAVEAAAGVADAFAVEDPDT